MQTPLKIGGVPEHFNFPFHLARREALAAFEWVDFPGGTGALCLALHKREIDVAIMLTEGLLANQSKGVGFESTLLSFYVQTPLVWGIHTAKANKYTSLQELQGKPIAISRPGSGSHLMSYVLAQREGWPIESLSFVEVGSLHGGRNALLAKEAETFLWEKAMTQPLVDAGEFIRLGELPTPWPAFVVVAKPDTYAERKEEIDHTMRTVLERAHGFKMELDAPKQIAQEYKLPLAQCEEWLVNTLWADYELPDPAQLIYVRKVVQKIALK